VIVAGLLQAGVARADRTDPAAAQALFDEAKKLAAQGRLSEACPKFLASYKLDRKPGAIFNLAGCYEKNGQTASAWARYLEAATLTREAKQVERERYAREHAAALEPKVPRVTIAVSGAPSGLEITLDGLVIDAATWGTAVPVDPGRHAVEARAPGRAPWSTSVEVSSGVRTRVDVPVLQLLPGPPPASEVKPGGWSDRRIAGVALMAGSGVGVVLGAVFGAEAHAKYGTLLQACPTHTGCSPTLASTLSGYHVDSATFVTSLVGAGLLLGSGLGLYLTAPGARPGAGAFVVPRVGPGYAGIEGRFR
jgi:hypothetical protein